MSAGDGPGALTLAPLSPDRHTRSYAMAHFYCVPMAFVIRLTMILLLAATLDLTHGSQAASSIVDISSKIVHVDGGDVHIRGTNLPEATDCLFRFKPNRIMTEHRVKAGYINSTSITCTVPRSPYRLVLHHQHRLPWPGCSWDERCMANSFSLSIDLSDKADRAPPPTFNMSFYLGSLNSVLSSDNNPQQLETDSKVLQEQLYALNHPRDCSIVPVLLFPSSTHQSQCTGIGMVFYAKYVTALKEAYEQGRALVFKDPFLSYCYFSDREHDAERYLLEPSNCTVHSINQTLATVFVPGSAWFTSIKKPQLFAAHNVAWFRSNFVRYMFRYTPSFEMHLTNAISHIGFEKPCIGVHLRRGERGNVGFTTVWLAEYPLFDLSDAARLLSVVKRRTGVKTVFLATDEPTFFEDAKRYLDEYRILHDTFYKRAAHGRDCVRETIAGCTPGVNVSSVVKTILTELHLLSQCRYYVGTLTSTFSKLAVDLMLSHFHNASMVLSLE